MSDATAVLSPAVLALPAPDPDPIAARARAYVQAAKAPATLRAYRSDWADFTSWCFARGVAALPQQFSRLEFWPNCSTRKRNDHFGRTCGMAVPEKNHLKYSSRASNWLATMVPDCSNPCGSSGPVPECDSDRGCL
jgi:hypothetical protein